MDGWVGGWVDGWMDEQVNHESDVLSNVCHCMDEWVNLVQICTPCASYVLPMKQIFSQIPPFVLKAALVHHVSIDISGVI